MKLYIEERKAAVPGGKAMVLVDEQGDALPCQAATTLTQEARCIGTMTVTFNVDGSQVQIGGRPEHWMRSALDMADKAKAAIAAQCCITKAKLDADLGTWLLRNGERPYRFEQDVVEITSLEDEYGSYRRPW